MAIRNSSLLLILAGSLSTSSLFGGLVSTASTSVTEWNNSQACSISAASVALCNSSGYGTAVATQAAAGYGWVEVGISGGSFGNVVTNGKAYASFSDGMTISGGLGIGILTETIQVLNFGQGSLKPGTFAGFQTIMKQRTFEFDKAFDFSLSSVVYASFVGTLCDGGSLLHSEKILSLSVSDVSGHPLQAISFRDDSNTRYNTTSGTFQSAVPEPGSWMLMGLGLVLVGVFATKARAAKR